jgi:sulfur relay (sulfurtransferase) DsrC/TusE family protein
MKKILRYFGYVHKSEVKALLCLALEAQLKDKSNLASKVEKLAQRRNRKIRDEDWKLIGEIRHCDEEFNSFYAITKSLGIE